jgi:hypothetical protein
VVGSSETLSTMPERISLGGAELRALLAALRSSALLPEGLPLVFSINDRQQTVSADWFQQCMTVAKRGFFAAWDENYESFLDYVANTIVRLGMPNAARDPSGTLSWIEKLPFQLASLEETSPAFLDHPDYPGPGFSNLHYPLGWACAFKGEGHRRLVSRRWLEFGPWRLLKGANDTSFVQFYDLSADTETAREQARIGHLRMGYTDSGGFIPARYVFTHPVDGLYSPDERRLRILVHGRQVSQREMLDASAIRLNQPLHPERPIDTVAYVFAVEEEARAHLHELWLRELECRTIIKGHEVRIDSEYAPKPQAPDWVLALR